RRSEVSVRGASMKGKWVVVTGAGSGIGRETALSFARAGADVVICARANVKGLAQTAADIRALGRQVISQRLDVSDRTQMKALADEVHGKIEAVDVVVNNAGVGL